MYPVTITTLGDLKARNYTLHASCTALYCSKNRLLDIDDLIARFGADYVFIRETRISAALRCSCGHKGGTTRLASIDPGLVNQDQLNSLAKNAYAKSKGV